MKTKLALTLVLVLQFFISNGQIIQFEFDSDLEEWTSESLLPNNFGFWDWASNGKADGGTYWNGRDSIHSESLGGAVRMDGDGNLASGTGNSDTPFETALRKDSFDFSGNSNVFLKFNQYYRNFSSSTRIETSIDGGMTWDTFPINTNVAQNVETSAADIQIVDLSSSVAGEPIVHVRFVFLGNYYFWILDDIEFWEEDPSLNTFPSFVGDSLQTFGYPFVVDDSEWAIVPNELVVQFKANVPEIERQELRDSLGVVKIDSCVCDRLELWAIGQPGGALLSADGNSIGINEIEKGSKGSSKIDGVDFNRYNFNDIINQIDTANLPLVPNDIDQSISPSSGNTIRVAILDTGIDIHHDSLVKYIHLNDDELNNDIDDDQNCYIDDLIGWNFVDNNNNPDDDHGHGTHVAGIIKQNFENYSELDCDLKIVPYKTHDFHGFSNLFHVTCATYQAINDSVSVINDSWGFYGDSSIILSNAIDTVKLHDILIVSAAGNDTIDLESHAQYPACYNDANILTVGSLDTMLVDIGFYDTLLSQFSNYNPICVDILAPGNNIYSTVLNNDMGYKSGTSMSAPAVAAIAAIFYCSGMNDYTEVRDSLLNCAKKFNGLSNQVLNGNILYFDPSCLSTVPINKVIKEELDITIFPNPTTDQIFIQPLERMENVQVKIYDLNGKNVFQKKYKNWDNQIIQSIEVNHIPSGIYFLNIQHSSYIWSYKMIKI